MIPSGHCSNVDICSQHILHVHCLWIVCVAFPVVPAGPSMFPYLSTSACRQSQQQYHPILPQIVLMFGFHPTGCSLAAALHCAAGNQDLIISMVWFCKYAATLCSTSATSMNFKWTERLFIHVQREGELFWSPAALRTLLLERSLTLRWSPSCYRPFMKCQRFTVAGRQR